MHIVNFRSFFLDGRGQDLLEYALMAGCVAVMAGALMPGIPAFIRAVVDVPLVTIRLVCAAVAIVLLVLIVRRRKGD